jgi:hypothetical protein
MGSSARCSTPGRSDPEASYSTLGSDRRRRSSPLSASVRRRLLRELLMRAERGDVAAAESLVRLSLAQTAATVRTCTCAMRIASGWGPCNENAMDEPE